MLVAMMYAPAALPTNREHPPFAVLSAFFFGQGRGILLDKYIEDDTIYEPYSKLITYLDGAKAVEVYKALHKTAKYCD